MSLSTIILILLVLLLFGALPRWDYSSGWGYGPSGFFGLLVVIILVVLLLAAADGMKKRITIPTNMRWLLFAVFCSVGFGQTTCVNCGGGGSSTPGGAVGSVQINDNGLLGGSALRAATTDQAAGTNLVTNGTFASGLTGWTVSGDGTGWSIVSGKLHHSPGNSNKITFPVSLISGDAYIYLVVLDSQSVGNAYLDLGADCFSDCSSNFIPGRNTAPMVSSEAGASVIELQPTSDWDGTVSSVSLQHPVLPLSMATAVAGNTDTYFGIGTLGASEYAGSDNTAFGFFSLCSNLSGTGNLAVGSHALQNNSVGSNNTAIGFSALKANTTANSNAGLGFAVLTRTTTGGANTGFGSLALHENTVGNFNSAFGYNSLYSTTGDNNVGLGAFAFRGNTSGSSNNVIGYYAAHEATTSSNLSAIITGEDDGVVVMRGSQKDVNNSVLIGPASTTGTNSNSGTPLTNVAAINGTATASNQTVLGNSSTTATFLFGIVNQPLHTPASSSEVCLVGDRTADANFYYVCSATNTWKRVALSGF